MREESKNSPDYARRKNNENGADGLSAEDLEKIVLTNLTSNRSGRSILPIWFIRILSMLAGAAAILLVFLLLR